jgi:4-hydroxybenzoyl-CoA reductase subunit beta
MLKLPEFEYHAPRTVDAALEILAGHGQNAKVMAGGTDLLPSMKQRLFTPEHLVSLRAIPALHEVSWDPGRGLSLGAMVTLRELTRSSIVRAHYPALASAAGQIATVTLQGMGTIGGNILLDTRCYYYNQGEFWREALGKCMKKDGTFCQVAKSSPKCLAAFSADTVPPLMLYGARATFVGPNGAREVALSEIYQDDGMDWVRIQPGEILTRVQLPPPAAGWAMSYTKVRIRQSIDYPLVGVGLGVKRAGDGTVEGARILLNAINSMPVDLEDASLLVGAPLTAERIEAIAQAAFLLVRPLTTHGVPPVYRKKMVKVTVRRALEALESISV